MKLFWIAIFSVAFASASLAADVSFKNDVLPIFQTKCFRCHGNDEAKGRLSLEPEKIAKHIRSSGQISPGRPDRSILVDKISATNAEDRMPKQGSPLTAAQITIIETWIEEGAELDMDSAPPAKEPLVTTLTNNQGKEIQATVLRVTGANVTLKVGDKTLDYPLANLSEDSQAKIKEWNEAKPEAAPEEEATN